MLYNEPLIDTHGDEGQEMYNWTLQY